MNPDIIDKIKSFGFDVYMRNKDDEWLIFSDGKNIGYFQDGLSGYSLSTLHKPNPTNGTGFSLGSVDSELTKEVMAAAFVFAPEWARDTTQVVKYKSPYEFFNVITHNKGYVHC